MSVLRNLEAKLGGLVEGAFSRAFKSSVEPVELARKLAKEMEESKTGLRLAHLRAQPLPRLPLAAGPRAVRELRAGAAQGAVGLPARARPRGAPGAHQPPGGGVHDRRAPGAGRVRDPGAAAHAARGGVAPRQPRRRAPSQGDFGHTMVYSPDRRRASSTRCRCAPTRAVLAGGRAAHGAERAAAWCSGAAASATSWSTTPTCRAATPSCAHERGALARSSTSAPPTASR